MNDLPHLGPRIRRWRKKRALTQAQMARELGISPSYLNHIEKGQRPLTVPILLKLSETYSLDLSQLADSDDLRLVAELREVLGDRLFAGTDAGGADLDALVGRFPEIARALTTLYRQYRSSSERTAVLAERLSDGEEVWGPDALRLPSEDVTEFIQVSKNHFPELETAAEDLWRRGELETATLFSQLSRYLLTQHGLRVEVARPSELPGAARRLDRDGGVLRISQALSEHSRRFQLAYQIALLEHGELLAELGQADCLTTDEARALARVALANYFAGAVLMPYEKFIGEGRNVRWDVELLEHNFGAGFEQVCHRMTTLRRRGDEGPPFHFLRVDVAGNISKRYAGSGIRFARYGGACPRWNVHSAFMTPGMISVQVSRMPDGRTYFCIARTVRKAGGGYHVPQSRLAIGLGVDMEYAREMVYSDGVELDNTDAAVPVGISCRLCERLDCRQRAFPPVHHRYKVDENVRGLSFYYEPEDGEGD